MSSLSRRRFVAATAAVAAHLAESCRRQPRRPPNIIFILADDLGFGDLGCYGQKLIRTPHLDRMAAEGMRFLNAYAGCTVCAPSRSVLLTGLHMGHTSVRSNPGGVPLEEADLTVAELLQPAGYRTGCFGKWGLGDIGTEGVPWRQGFDEFFGYLHQVHAHYHYPAFLYRNEERHPLEGNTEGRRTSYAHDAIAREALDFIRRSKDRPFFCYVPFTLPHLELLVPEDSMAEYRGRFPEPKPYRDPRNHYAAQPEPRTALAGMITRMDRDVGRILALVQELGIDEETLVLFSSDNGAATPLWQDDFFRSTGGLRGHKQNLYEGGIRVPLIARWPGRISAGTTSAHLCGFWDFLPTACELAGVPIPPHTDGLSFLPSLLGREDRQGKHEFLYWELPRYDAQTGRFHDEVPMQAVRMGPWKAVRPKPDAPLELYNLEQDPGESINVAAAQPEVMARIEEFLKRARYEPRPQLQPEHSWWQSAG